MNVRIFSMILVLFLASSCALNAQGAPLKIASDGKSDYTIILSEKASGSEKHGARELQLYLRKMTGADIAIATDADKVPPPFIFIGKSALLDALALNIPWKELGDEGYVIRTAGANLVLAGSRVRGSMYACYGFLEDHLGCHWLLPDVEVIPKKSALRIGRINEKVKPAFGYRHSYNINVRDIDWAVRNRQNDIIARFDIPEALGGQFKIRPPNHSFHYFVDPRKYFKEHPEYFPLIDGKRVGTFQLVQIAMTNPEVVDIVTEGVLKIRRDDPTVKAISVLQNDCANYDTSPEAQAIYKREEAHSGAVIEFVNKIAERVEKEFPDLYLITAGYRWSFKPPKYVRPRKNVILYVARTLEGWWLTPLDDPKGKGNEKFKNGLKGWKEITDKIIVWDYHVQFNNPLQPVPNFHVLGPNHRFYRDNGIWGIFDEAGGSNFPKGANFAHLRAWVMVKLLWNPDLDVDKLIDIFLDGYYGAAAPYIRQYLDLTQKEFQKSGLQYQRNGYYGFLFFTPENIALANSFFEKALEQVSADKELTMRVRVERMALDWVIMRHARRVAYELKKDKLALKGNVGEAQKKARARVMATLKDAGPERLGKKAIIGVHKALRATVPPIHSAYNTYSLINKDIKLLIIPGLGGRIWEITDRATGKQLLYKAPPDGPGYPHDGGYSEILEGEEHGLGRREVFKVIAKSNTSITIESDLPREWKMRRRVSIPKTSGASFVIESRVTNASRTARKTGLRMDPPFMLGNAANLKLWKKKSQGKWDTLEVTALVKAHDTKFKKGVNMPAGAWAVYSAKEKFGIVQNLKKEKIVIARMKAFENGPYIMFLYAPEKQLRPNESFDVKVSYDMIYDRPNKAR